MRALDWPLASGNISQTSGKQFPIVTSTPVIICIIYTASDLQQTFSLFKIKPKFRRRSEGEGGLEKKQEQEQKEQQ